MSLTSWSSALRLPSPDRWKEFRCGGGCGLVERRPILPADPLCRDCRRRQSEASERERTAELDLGKAMAVAGVPPLYRDATRSRMEADAGKPWGETTGLVQLARWCSAQWCSAQWCSAQWCSSQWCQAPLCQADARRPEDWIVLIYGASQRAGCLASAVFREMLASGLRGRCALMSEWLNELRAGFDRGSGVSSRQVFGDLAAAEVLLLLHVQRPESEWGCQQVADLLMMRRVHLRPTIVTAGYRRWDRIRGIHPSLRDLEIREGLRVPVASG